MSENLNRALEKGLQLGKPSDVSRGHIQTGGADKVTIGKYVVLGLRSSIITHCPIKSFSDNPYIEIADLVWIGMGSIILPGVKIMRGTFIGAGSVLPAGNYKQFSIYAGNPAKRIRTLTPLEVLRTYCVRWKLHKALDGKFDIDWNKIGCRDINYIFKLPREEKLKIDPVGHLIPWKNKKYDIAEFRELING